MTLAQNDTGVAADRTGLLDGWLDRVDVDGRLDVRCELAGAWTLEAPPGASRDIAFHALLEGTAVAEADGLPPTRLDAGDLLLLPGGGAHRLHGGVDAVPSSAGAPPRTAPPAGALLCGRFILPPAAMRLVRQLLPAALVVRGGPAASASSASSTDAALATLLGLMRAETDTPAPGSPTVLRHLSGALFALALRAASRAEAPPPGLLALAAQPRLAGLALRLIESPERDWTLERMAEAAHVSRSSLIRAFQAAAGLSPADFLTGLRMTEAQRRLRQRAESVGAVGEAVGYASEAAFQRAFKRETGLTPAEWRDTAPSPGGDEPPPRPPRREWLGAAPATGQDPTPSTRP